MKKLLFLTKLFSVIFCTAGFAQWTNQSSGTVQHLKSIYATGTSNVFASGNNGTGIKTTNSGVSWTSMSLGSSLTHYSLRFINSTTGFTVGDGQEILKTTSSGGSWTNIGIGTTSLYDCYFTSSSSGWVAGDIEVGYGFLYNPFTFNLIQIPANANKVLRGIYFAGSTTGWVVGDGGLIIKTTNNGTSWTQQTSGSTNQLNKIMFIDANNGIVVGNAGTILKTINGGTSWASPSSGTIQNLNAIYYADASNVWVCGNNGIILRSSDGGLTWTAETSGTTEILNAIHGIGVSDIWACGNNGKIIYRSGTAPVFETPFSPNVSVYPNPGSGIFIINNNVHISLIEIYSMLGDKIYSSDHFQTNTSSRFQIDLSNQPKGIYFVKIYNGDKIHTEKIVIQ